jgi:hypothetical protein
MGRTRTLVLELYSRRRLDEEFAQAQLRALTHFREGIFLPERCDVYEPLRETFDPTRLEEPVRWLITPGGEFKFRRTRPVGIFGYLENKLFPQVWLRDSKKSPRQEVRPTVPEPIFCTQWVVWINRTAALKQGFRFLEDFLLTIYRASESDYGFLAMEEDRQEKNYLRYDRDDAIGGKYVGDNPEKGIPGLYWMNVFGKLYVSWFGKERFEQVPSTAMKFLPDGSALIQFGNSPDAWSSAEVTAQQHKAIQILGEQAFFDISHPDRTLLTPFGRQGEAARPETLTSHIQ